MLSINFCRGCRDLTHSTYIQIDYVCTLRLLNDLDDFRVYPHYNVVYMLFGGQQVFFVLLYEKYSYIVISSLKNHEIVTCLLYFK